MYFLYQCAHLGRCATSMSAVRNPLHTVIILYRKPGYLSRYSESLRAGRSGIESQWGARFSALVQTGYGEHPPP